VSDAAADYMRQYLDSEYVARVARETTARLREGVPVAIPYEPGNMTRYELVLTPMESVAESPSTHPVAHDSPRNDSICIAIVNEFATAIVLPILNPNFWLHPSYISEKMNVGDGDALALLALFQEISRQ
jgi:hypothetical protein